MGKQVIEKYFCDFCGAEKDLSQTTKVSVSGHISGDEICCPACLKQILELLHTLREKGPQKQQVPKRQAKKRWWNRL